MKSPHFLNLWYLSCESGCVRRTQRPGPKAPPSRVFRGDRETLFILSLSLQKSPVWSLSFQSSPLFPMPALTSPQKMHQADTDKEVSISLGSAIGTTAPWNPRPPLCWSLHAWHPFLSQQIWYGWLFFRTFFYHRGLLYVSSNRNINKMILPFFKILAGLHYIHLLKFPDMHQKTWRTEYQSYPLYKCPQMQFCTAISFRGIDQNLFC